MTIAKMAAKSRGTNVPRLVPHEHNARRKGA
ncbi:hypothetical protein RLDS_00500 [Sphingobium lactosutens DS20]|jgi:hypothetical protein|uniref:Uncharacterized protein n=1 Tax=Sphingobium lactosutens DS20 TaxID=1331060 RepID=T0I472_9SPHN|nr:hypothetical protein RLDS_00500 [Sphingobium lactosutens DS20]